MNKKSLWAVLALVIASGAAYGLAMYKPSSTPAVNTSARYIETPTQNIETVQMIVNGQTGEIYNETLEVAENTTVLQLMQNAGMELETKEYSFGTAVEGINGVNQKDANGKFWALYVDTAKAQEGASTLIAKPGSLIEWKLE